LCPVTVHEALQGTVAATAARPQRDGALCPAAAARHNTGLCKPSAAAGRHLPETMLAQVLRSDRLGTR